MTTSSLGLGMTSDLCLGRLGGLPIATIYGGETIFDEAASFPELVGNKDVYIAMSKRILQCWPTIELMVGIRLVPHDGRQQIQ
jgi:hypothetical protein